MSPHLLGLRLVPGEPAGLDARPTRITPPPYASRSDYGKRLRKRVKAMAKLQRVLQAERRHALLVVLQAMDAGGKDGTVRHVFSGLNPQGCQIWSFGPPTREELLHDFLWRTTARLPPRGCIGVFNRSYYEEVLAVRVHPALLGPEGLEPAAEEDGVWDGRFRSIVEHEAHLERNGVRLLKVFLHVSQEEQRRRLLRRIDRPDHQWKIDPSDIAERARWSDYAQAYEACLAATSTKAAPWFIVPGDDKRTARLLVAALVRDALEALHPAYPAASPERRAELEQERTGLAEEDGG